ncbi:MGMT family protein [Bacillus coahuilensis]|uniref:MGMT family protein n=1 Tax=Bacillus coahuilensis TaxID=408580 RepID=UPI0001850C76|nr:MGMT family protein [Bacillus coahuilensis]
MTEFTERTLMIISEIPKGKVMTYGQVAYMAGSPKAARQVVRILHSMSEKYHLPWHRVVNKKGEIALRSDDAKMEQITRLEAEGITVQQGVINLDEFQWMSE